MRPNAYEYLRIKQCVDSTNPRAVVYIVPDSLRFSHCCLMLKCSACYQINFLINIYEVFYDIISEG